MVNAITFSETPGDQAFIIQIKTENAFVRIVRPVPSSMTALKAFTIMEITLLKAAGLMKNYSPGILLESLI